MRISDWSSDVCSSDLPLYPQHGVPLASPLMGVPYSGQYEGKLLWIHHTHDASLWPPQGIIYKQAVEAAQGPEKAREKFRMQWTENAEHVTPMLLPTNPEIGSASCRERVLQYV